MTQIKQIFADLSICKSTKYNQWSSVASASSACHFIFRPPLSVFPVCRNDIPQQGCAARSPRHRDCQTGMAENPATNRLFASAGPKVRLGWTEAKGRFFQVF